jgi:hypothetical protein
MRNTLTVSDVRKARQLYREGCSLAWIARRFRVHHTTIRAAVIGLTWKHVPGAVDAIRKQKSEASIQRIAREVARESAP